MMDKYLVVYKRRGSPDNHLYPYLGSAQKLSDKIKGTKVIKVHLTEVPINKTLDEEALKEACEDILLLGRNKYMALPEIIKLVQENTTGALVRDLIMMERQSNHIICTGVFKIN